MKTWLLPLTTTLGAAGAFVLMLATQAAPAAEDNTEAMRQIGQMEHQSRLREWSQGLGIDLSGNPAVARAQEVSPPAADAQRTSDRRRTRTYAVDGNKHHERADRHDRSQKHAHEDDDETAS